MSNYCWVVNCGNNSSFTDVRTVKYHTLPKDDRLDNWLINIGRPEIIQSPSKIRSVASKRVCSDHFEESAYTLFLSRLKPNAIPTIFKDNQEQKSGKDIIKDEDKTRSIVNDQIITIPNIPLDSCRICLKQNGPLIPLSETCNETNVTYVDMIKECFTQFHFETEESLIPNTICECCSNELLRSYSFMLVYKNSEETLKSYLESVKQFQYKNQVILEKELKDQVTFEVIKESKVKEEIVIEDCPQVVLIKETSAENQVGFYEETVKSKPDIDALMAEWREIKAKSSKSEEKNVKKDKEENGDSILQKVLSGFSVMREHDYGKSIDTSSYKYVYSRDDYKLVEIKADGSHLDQLPNRELPTKIKIYNDHIKVFECRECDKKFYTFPGLMAHLRKCHRNYVKVRSYKFKKKHDFKRYSSEEGFLCPICGKKFMHDRNFYSHISRHKNTKYPCEICSKTITSKLGLKEHMSLHRNEKPFLCSYCGKSFRLRSSMRQHEQSHANNVKYKCSCDKIFGSRSGLRNCLRKHKDMGKSEHKQIKRTSRSKQINKCTMCNIDFDTYKKYRNHLRQHEITKKRCPYCKKIFANERIVDAHCLDVHARNYNNFDEFSMTQNHKCAACHISCDGLQSLEEHARSCLSSFQCDDCPLSFETAYMFILHFERTHVTKLHSCAICAKRFSSRLTLKAHERTHNKTEYKFSCDYCLKRFLYKQKLNDHLRTHTGERPFKCSTCQKSFALQRNLIIHERRHVNFKPYNCHECSMNFYDSSARRKHCRSAHNGRGEQPNEDVSAVFDGV